MNWNDAPIVDVTPTEYYALCADKDLRVVVLMDEEERNEIKAQVPGALAVMRGRIYRMVAAHTCARCGCTNEQACAGGRSWRYVEVGSSRGICSTCAGACNL